MSWDEAVAEANAASPPDAPLLKIRAHAADSMLGSASFETAGEDSGRRWPFLFERLLRFGPRAALAASLVGFAGVAGAYFSGGQLPFFARTPLPASIDGPQLRGERAEILHTVQQMADEIGALKARVEAVHTQSPSAKEATALEGLKARLDAVKTETGAEIAELAGKVDRLQRELTTKLAKVSEGFDRPDHRGAVPRAAASKAPRGDAFDPSQNPGAPGAPRPLGSLAPAAKGPVKSF
jgi:HAMP domain-containing protein